MAKLTEAELDAWADYWSRYFDGVLSGARYRRAEESRSRQAAFQEKQEENEDELERRRWERFQRTRAM